MFALLPIAVAAHAAAPPSPEAAGAAGAGGDLNTAQELSNPLSSLISVPLQSDFDFGGTPGGLRYNANLQPVVPFRLKDDLTLIARTIVPFYDANGVQGIGDTTESLFLSPASHNGFTYGVGPVLQLPTATQNSLGSRQLAIGPTGVALQKRGPMLFGLLVNQLWGVTGPPRGRSHVDQLFIQPFFSYTFPTKTTLVVNTEASYQWKSNQWTVPVNLFVNQLFSYNGQKVQLGIGPRYFAERAPGAQRWGFRFNMTLVFPTASGAK